MKHFADPRPRDGQGQFAGADTGGLDSSSMNVAYAPNIIAARKRVLSQKAIAEVGRLKDEGGSGVELSSIPRRIKELAKRFKKVVKNAETGRTRTVRYGQSGKAADGGDRIRPSTKKADAYCARSNKIGGDWRSDPNSPNNLSRRKWKCRGDVSMR